MAARSSCTNPEPGPLRCEVCGGSRLKTINLALCWVCWRLHASAAKEAATEAELYKLAEGVVP